MGKSTISMAIFNSYVSLPKGKKTESNKTHLQNAEMTISNMQSSMHTWWFIETITTILQNRNP